MNQEIIQDYIRYLQDQICSCKLCCDEFPECIEYCSELYAYIDALWQFQALIKRQEFEDSLTFSDFAKEILGIK